jgi:hypothetical protein
MLSGSPAKEYRTVTLYILIIIGSINGQPQVGQAGTFQTVAACQRQWQLLAAAAYTTTNRAKDLAGVCLAYKRTPLTTE